MTKFKHLALLLLAAVVMFGCSNYNDTELRNDVSDLQSRVEKLEAWCTTANGQITALQGMVTALQANDYVTGVTPVLEGASESEPQHPSGERVACALCQVATSLPLYDTIITFVLSPRRQTRG